jgi:hypothetical protein
VLSAHTLEVRTRKGERLESLVDEPLRLSNLLVITLPHRSGGRSRDVELANAVGARRAR